TPRAVPGRGGGSVVAAKRRGDRVPGCVRSAAGSGRNSGPQHAPRADGTVRRRTGCRSAPDATPVQLRDPLAGTRVTEPPALARVAAQLGEPLGLYGRLHPLGRDLDAERVGELDQRA